VTKGSAPAMSITVDANNRVTGQSFDANGNLTSGAGSTLTYDVDNRILTATDLPPISAHIQIRQAEMDVSRSLLWRRQADPIGAHRS